MERRKRAANLLREQHDVFVLGAENHTVALEGAEVARRGQRRGRPMP